MKLVHTIIFVCFINAYLSAQTISGMIKDSSSNQPISSVTISMLESKESVSSDNYGRYYMEIGNNKDKLLVSCVGYQSVLIDLNNFIDKNNYTIDLSLIPKVEELKEIVITNTSKGNYILKKIGLKKATDFGWLLQSGHEICTLVKTPFKEEQYIKSVILNLEKRLSRKSVLSNYFKINFYEYNENEKKPGAKINVEDIIIFPENKNYSLVIDVNTLSIPFPNKGLCIAIEAIKMLDISYDEGPRDISSKEKLKNYRNQKELPAPLFGFSKSNKDSDIQTWERNIDKQTAWGKCPVNQLERYSDTNLKINVEVKIKDNEK
jgi:hypothetical protein